MILGIPLDTLLTLGFLIAGLISLARFLQRMVSRAFDLAEKRIAARAIAFAEELDIKLATHDEKLTSAIERLDHINGSVGRHNSEIVELRVAVAKLEGIIFGKEAH